MKFLKYRTIKTSADFLTFAMACLVVTSCIPRDEDDFPLPPAPDPLPAVSDTAQIDIDSIFTPTTEYMHGEWMAQYEGFDLKQMRTSSIRRLMFFSPDGFYDSHVQGIVNIEDTITSYKEFEHEHGTYSYDSAKRILSYKIEYDSLLNFATDRLEYSPGKIVMGTGLVKEYDEMIWFSKEKEGNRDWIRKDDNLVTEDNHSINVIYVMKSRNEN